MTGVPDDAETRLVVGRKTTEAETKLAADVGQNKREMIHTITAMSTNNDSPTSATNYLINGFIL